ncbi:MAG: ABC transporter ATP-binding protein [Candidatus Heimdallarchaeota archaeon]|nr:ABC transporter ATP-binding protein [Candidatus Heimdallarchaeota archaeon]
MSIQEYIVETKNLVKHYNKGEVKAVNGLDLKVKRGEIYAFIGANGAGKTTALDMISGVLYPTSGTIIVDGLEIPRERKRMAHMIGVAPQDVSVYSDLTVKENIMFFADLYRLEKAQSNSRMKELLGVLKLEEKENELVRNLSGGMKRRVSIACALIHDPKLLLFDEATVGVDPVLRQWFWKYFKELSKKGTTLIITSHVMDEAEKADRIGLIRAGVLIEEGTPAELKEKYRVQTIEEVFLKLAGDEFINE